MTKPAARRRAASAAITFVVSGVAETGGPPPRVGRLKASVRIGAGRDEAAAAARGGVDGRAGLRGGLEPDRDGVVRVSAEPGRDVVVLSVVNGPTLVLHPQAASDLLRAQAPLVRGAAPATRADGEVVVPVELGWPGIERAATRGLLGRAVLGGLKVLTGFGGQRAGRLLAAAATKKVDAQVNPGVYALSVDALEPLKASGARPLPAVPPAADGGPMLVLVHGTFSNTAGTFGKLWSLHATVVRALFARYAGRVYALDHPTLGVSPIANALQLARALPAGARVHLLTHSRGGLVGELLALACQPGAIDSAEALRRFAGAGYAAHRDDLRALAAEAGRKAIRVERIVRVACPSRGTLLASKRLDAYLSVLSWCLELATLPVAAELVDLLHEVALRRAEPDELPGLEAMMPTSPVIGLVNDIAEGRDARPREPIAGDLRVVAGDLQGDGVVSWAKTLLADAFYWTDNDLVVQTRSMYGGAARARAAAGSGAARFLLDRGAGVSHFAYFANERTVQAISRALLDDEPEDYAAIGPLSWAGEDASGTRAAAAVARSRGPVAGDAATLGKRPAVIVIPGILGSNLALDGERVWLGFRFVNALERLAWNPRTATRVTPDGPIASVYGALVEHLAKNHEVIPFAFDWRRPIEDEATRLAAEVDAALTARTGTTAAVRIVAHSMGGLVARTMALQAPAVWKRFLTRDGARFLMLGTPNGGSWAPMQTLSGDDTFGNALAAFGSLFDNRGARDTMAGMPGFLQMQAGLLDDASGLARADRWQQIADEDVARVVEHNAWHLEGVQRTVYRWGAPPQAVLDRAVALRRALDAQAAALGDAAGVMRLVVGAAPFTPGGYVMTEAGVEYVAAPGGGDGRVAHASAWLPGVRTWTLAASHGDLPSVAAAFPAYAELLENGETSLLEVFEPPPTRDTRGARAAPGGSSASPTPGAAPSDRVARSRPSRGLLPSAPPSSPADTLRGAPAGIVTGRPRQTALHVSVLNVDLRFVHQPLLVGHYVALALTGSEAVVDRLVAGAMSRSLAAGLYPNAVGTQQIFGNIRRDPNNVLAMARPCAVVVAGLGEEGKLRAAGLTQTVRQAAIAYAQRLAETPDLAPAEFELASTLVGSGGAGISTGTAAQAIAAGVQEANERLAAGGWPQVGRLVLIELYLDRASDAWHSLQVQSTASPHQFQVDGPVLAGAGALRRSLDSSYRGAAYDFISAESTTASDGTRSIVYNLDTKRARTEVRAQRTQGTLVDDLVAKASNDANRDPQIGRTLFDLLVPVEMEPFLGGTTEMVIELDLTTAALPWELLDPRDAQLTGGDPRPWSIRSKLLRKLRTADFRPQPVDAGIDGGALVIGEPLVDDQNYPPLPGARAEGMAVAERLVEGAAGLDAGQVRALTSGTADARDVVNALFERPYRVIHVAGHGAPGAVGGVVLSGGNFLGPAEIAAMRVVPELVFLNCCHLAAYDMRSAQSSAVSYDRAHFAANLADALIAIGVRCVVAAGWAVEDGPAEIFATSFYDVLLSGGRFIDAVAAAREAAWRANPAGNTWAAYQCYGDPGWTWRRGLAGAPRGAIALAEEYAGVSSAPALVLALETIATGLRFGGDVSRDMASLERQRDRIRWLEARFAPLWGTMGAVAEAFGLACAGARLLDASIAWYRKAVDAEDGSASYQSAEQLANQLARRAEDDPDTEQARRTIGEAVAILERLLGLHPTAERESLLGSAWKRLVMVEGRDDRPLARGRKPGRARDLADPARLSALRKMALHYGRAEQLAARADADNAFYSAKNGISAELRLAFLERRPAELAADRLQAVREQVERAARDRPDFWSVVGTIELAVLGAVAAEQLAGAADDLVAEFRALKSRVPALDMWGSVHAEARFTLEPYAAIATPAERKAASAMLEALAAMARAA